MALRLIEMMVPKASAGDLKSCLGDQPVLQLHELHCGGGQTFVRISNAARGSGVYVAMMVLSAILATIGLYHNSVAIIFGAMVIAPLLGRKLYTNVLR
jgi:hypothetical protein